MMGTDWLAGRRTAPSDGSGWRVPPAVVVALAVLACAQAAACAATAARGHPQGTSLTPGQLALYALALCLLALAGTVPLALRRPAAAAVTITVAAAVMLAWARQASAAGAIAALLAAFRLGTVPPGPRSLGRGPLAAIVVTAAFLVMALAMPDRARVLLAAGVPIAAGTGIAIRAGRSASGEDEARSVLTDTLAEHLARGERARIARELHDVVAHHISMIAVRAEAARLTTPGMPEAGAERLREIGDTARAGLAEMRRLLGVLREDGSEGTPAQRQPQPGLPQVATLVDTAREAGGCAVRLIVSGPVTSLHPGVELAAYRIVQEALTNARRHAPGAAVDVELRYDDDMLRLRIRDNGPGPQSRDGGGAAGGTPGHGLLGMRERAAAVGGQVRTGAAPGGGFLVQAVLPAKPDEAGRDHDW
jgi:signal transduction histidine kinase